MAYRARQTSGRGKLGDPTCNNCHQAGHSKRNCWLPGGGAEGKGPHQKKKGKSKQMNKWKDDKRKKPRDNANQAVSNKSDSDHKEHKAFMVTTSSHSHSHFQWVLDGGSTTHICNDHSMFATFMEKYSMIGGIQKSAPSLKSKGFGDILLTCTVNGESDQTITLINVAYCPDARDNLVSESHMALKFINEMVKSKSFVRMAPCLCEATYKAVSTSLTVTLHQPHRHPNLLSLRDILNLSTSGTDVSLTLVKTHYFIWPSMTLSQEWISAQMVHLGHVMDVLRANTLRHLS